MALTRITKGVIKPNENYDTHNINSTGIVTAIGLDVNGNGDISGNLSVGGVLTYEDVTSIDSVGIITAQKDIHVGAGISVVGIVTAATGDFFNLDVDGHTNLDNGNIAGIVTFNSGSSLQTDGGQILLKDRPDGNSNNLFFGTGGKAVIYHDGTNFSQVNNTGHFYLGQGVGNKDLMLYAQASGNVLLQQNTGVRYVKGVGSDASVQLFFNNNLRLNTTDAGVSIPKDLDVDGHTNLDNVSIAGVSTFSGNVSITNTNPKLFFYDTNNDSDYAIVNNGGVFRINDETKSLNRLSIDSNGNVSILNHLEVTGISTFNDNIRIADSKKLLLGNLAAGDCQFIHDGNDTFIQNKTGDLKIANNVAGDVGGDIIIQALNGEDSIKAIHDGAVELYHNGTKRLETSSVGVSIPQDLDVDGHTNLDNVSIVGIASITNVDALRLNSATGTYQTFQYNGIARGYTGTANHLYTGGSNGDFGFAGGASANIVFATANEERLRIASTGELGLGLTQNPPTGSFTMRLTETPEFNIYSTQHAQNNNIKINFGVGQSASVSGNTGARIEMNIPNAGGQMTGDLIFHTNSGDNLQERLRIDSDGQVQIGSGTIKGGGHLTIRGGGVNTYACQDYQYVGTPSNNSTTIAQLRFTANTTGASVVQGAKIQAVSDAAWSATGDAPTRLEFHTTADGSASMVNKMTITSGGQVRLPVNGQELTWGASQQMKFYYENSEDRMYLKGDGAYGFAFRVNNGNALEIDKTTRDVTMQGASGRNFLWDNSEPSLYLTDNGTNSARLKIGTGGDLQLYHDVSGNVNHISAATNGEIKFSANQFTFYEYTGVTQTMQIDSAARLRTRGAPDTGHGGMVYIQGYSDPIADETHSNLTVRGEGGNGFACGTYEGTGNYASWIQAGYVLNFTGGSPAAIYPLVLQPNGGPVCIGNYNDASTDDGGLLRIQTKDGATKVWHDYGLTLEHIDGSNARHQKWAFINASNQGTTAHSNSKFRHYAVPYTSNTTNQVFTDQINYAHVVGFNQYSWYKFNVHATSSSRGGSCRIAITWTSRHAGPAAYGEYSFAWYDEHHTSRIQLIAIKEHFLHYGGGSYYGWNSTPDVTVYSSTGGGSAGGFYLRVEGHVDANSSTYDGGIMHHFNITHNDNNCGGNNSFFEFVSNASGGPSQASQVQNFN